MKKGKYLNARAVKRANKKLIALALALVLTIGGVVGGTLAWLTDDTTPVTNTFTDSDINIELDESTGAEYKMIPGHTIPKDPKVTVKAGSEDCWVFIKVEEKGVTFTREGKEVTYDLDDFIDYSIDGHNWALVPDQTNVYYIKATNITSDRVIKILENEQVTVDEEVTKLMMDDVETHGKPTLTFTAYAVQLYKSNGVEFEPAEAWAKISK